MSSGLTPARAGLGTYIEVDLIDGDGAAERVAFDIVSEKAADFAQGRLSVTAPLAQAIDGHVAGSEVPYAMGDIVSVRLVSVRLSDTQDDAAAEAQRQAVLDKARADAERTNAAIFASSFSGKWGDYDPQGVEQWADNAE